MRFLLHIISTKWWLTVYLTGAIIPCLSMAQGERLLLKAFEANLLGSEVKLSWAVQNIGRGAAKGNFWLERSCNGTHWQRLTSCYFYLATGRSQAFALPDRYQDSCRHYRLVRADFAGHEAPFATTYLQVPNSLVQLEATIVREANLLLLNYLLDKDKNLLLRIYDRIGHQVLTEHIPSGNAGSHAFARDLSSFRPGVYLLVITQVEDNLTCAERRIEW